MINDTDIRPEDYTRYNYEIKTPDADPSKTVIRKTGIDAEFTLHDIGVSIQEFMKRQVEVESELRVHAAKMKNIDREYPKVKKMSKRERIAAAMWHNESVSTDEKMKTLEQLRLGIQEYLKEAKVIGERLGIDVQAIMNGVQTVVVKKGNEKGSDGQN